MILVISPLIVLGLFLAWRLSKVPADPDWSAFNLWGQTGSVYGRDFADCKTPAIHVWYWLLSKIVGRSVERVKFLHLTLLSVGAAYLTLLLTGNFWAALTALILITTGHLNIQGNVGQQPMLLLIVALAHPDGRIAALAACLALAFEPKLLPAVVVMAINGSWTLPLAIYGAAALTAAVLFRSRWPEAWGWIWESSITIPMRIAKRRSEVPGLVPWVPDYLKNSLVYFIPWVVAGVWARPDPWYWLAPTLFMAFQGMGAYIRPNHWTPVAAWVVVAQPEPFFVAMLLATDLLSSGFYLGSGKEIFKRFYAGIADMIDDTKAVGLWLRDKPGRLWVNGLSSEIYIYAQKPVVYGMAEIIEVASVANERRERMKGLWQGNSAEWVVTAPDPVLRFVPNGYQRVAKSAYTEVWQKVGA